MFDFINKLQGKPTKKERLAQEEKVKKNKKSLSKKFANKQ